MEVSKEPAPDIRMPSKEIKNTLNLKLLELYQGIQKKTDHREGMSKYAQFKVPATI